MAKNILSKFINQIPSIEKLIKIGLAILLVTCLFPMPYGYFQFVRFISLIVFGILAYNANQKGQQIEQVIFIVLAILFQPLVKISLGRTIWSIVDVIVAFGLIISVFSPNQQKADK